MIKASQSSIRHPLTDDSPCRVLQLQYADDTLIVIRGEPKDVQCLKATLDSFAETIGLKIHFSKTTVVTIHMDEGAFPSLAAKANPSRRLISAFRFP